MDDFTNFDSLNNPFQYQSKDLLGGAPNKMNPVIDSLSFGPSGELIYNKEMQINNEVKQSIIPTEPESDLIGGGLVGATTELETSYIDSLGNDVLLGGAGQNATQNNNMFSATSSSSNGIPLADPDDPNNTGNSTLMYIIISVIIIIVVCVFLFFAFYKTDSTSFGGACRSVDGSRLISQNNKNFNYIYGNENLSLDKMTRIS